MLVEKMSNRVEDNRQDHQKDDYLQPNGKVPHGQFCQASIFALSLRGPSRLPPLTGYPGTASNLLSNIAVLLFCQGESR